jgi:hypothetical protein
MQCLAREITVKQFQETDKVALNHGQTLTRRKELVEPDIRFLPSGFVLVHHHPPKRLKYLLPMNARDLI